MNDHSEPQIRPPPVRYTQTGEFGAQFETLRIDRDDLNN